MTLGHLCDNCAPMHAGERPREGAARGGAVSASRWNHAVCGDCWFNLFPDAMRSLPTRMLPKGEFTGQIQMPTCCFCGRQALSGIFARHDPAESPCRGATEFHIIGLEVIPRVLSPRPEVGMRYTHSKTGQLYAVSGFTVDTERASGDVSGLTEDQLDAFRRVDYYALAMATDKHSKGSHYMRGPVWSRPVLGPGGWRTPRPSGLFDKQGAPILVPRFDPWTPTPQREESM